MAIKLDPEVAEAARKKGSQTERGEPQKETIQEAIEQSKRGKSVVVIPPPAKTYTGEQTNRKLRVAAYCRVSTQEEEQENSFDIQVHHFEQRIKSNPAWEFVDIYKDKGISGTSVQKRLEFQRMINDAVAGKIDLILTKSISRFGRNVVDVNKNLRLLVSLPNPVAVEFETEGITYSGDGTNNLVVSILTALAEMESQQKSEAIKAGIRWRMAEGIYKFTVKYTLGFYRDNFGRIRIEPTEAKIVEYIYDSFLAGATSMAIAAALTEQGIPTPRGKEKWRGGTIISILRNEKYCGDALMQKTFTKDFLTHKTVKNTELNQFFKEDHHVAIIPREKWNRVQELLNMPRRYRNATPLNKLENSFTAKRVKDGLFQGFFILDARWTIKERRQFLKILSNTMKDKKGE